MRIYQYAACLVSPPSRPQGVPALNLFAGGVAAAGVLSLVFSNPSLEDYQAHAGEQLVTLGAKELCDEPTLPMMLRLWIRNCPELIASQRDALAALAGQFTTRRNLVVISLYSTQMGGQEMLPGLRLPGIDVLTLGVAGRFVILRTDASKGASE